MTDAASAASWRPEIERVEIQREVAGATELWVEVDGDGDRVPYRTLRSEPPTLLVREVADPHLPYAGTWTFELAPFERGTRLVITERGVVASPTVRLAAAYLIGHRTLMHRYLRAVGEHFDESVEPRPID